jgi:hypothetical protein
MSGYSQDTLPQELKKAPFVAKPMTEADDRVGVDRYGPKYIPAVGSSPQGYLQSLGKTSASRYNRLAGSINSGRLFFTLPTSAASSHASIAPMVLALVD